MIGHFLTVLMQVLMHKSHDLLKEEIILAAFHMANVDFGTVHVLTEQFLPSNFLVKFTIAFYGYTYRGFLPYATFGTWKKSH